MMSPDTACIAFKLSQAEYRPLFEQVWGKDSLNIKFPSKTDEICATPGGAAVFGTDTTPVKLSPEDRLLANRAYDNWGQSISFYERSKEVSPFTSKFDAFLASPTATWIPFAPNVDGQFQVSSARNVAMVPLCPPGSPPGCVACPTTEAPGPYFQKEFFHNGFIKSLKQLVHFYNTRDLFAQPVTSGHCPPGTTEKVDCWPVPEVKNNIDMTTGNLALTDLEENQIVAFLQTLTDGFTTPYPNINTFTGACMTAAPGTANASAST